MGAVTVVLETHSQGSFRKADVLTGMRERVRSHQPKLPSKKLCYTSVTLHDIEHTKDNILEADPHLERSVTII